MKYFIKRLFIFLSIPIVILTVVFIAVPETPRSEKSLLFSKLDKDYLLRNTSAPRLILMGGSNLSFGIDSSMLEQELGITPINTAIQATIGTYYIMDTILDNVQTGDILVMSIEYSQYFGRHAYGGEELLRTVMDVDRSTINKLRPNQWLNLIVYFPKYSISKIKPTEYILKENIEIGIYERESFNQYGDAVVHWGHNHSDFPPYDRIEGRFNHKFIKDLLIFEQQVEGLDATLYITFPGLQETTFQIMEDQIRKVESELIKNGFNLLGTPDRYMITELLMYNTPYHLNREGVVYRTGLLIEDLQAAGIIPGESE